MNMIDQARQAYGAAISSARTARTAEQHIIAEATSRLRAAASDPRNFPRLAAALHDNRRLWTRLAADVADDGNGLPQALRARLFYLAEFTNHHSALVLQGKADAGPLIDINIAVMRGLSGQPGPAVVA